MPETPRDEASDKIETLEQPVQELSEEEAAQVEGGGFYGSGVYKAKPDPEPTPLVIKMKDVLVSS